jgi:hypothetical protein
MGLFGQLECLVGQLGDSKLPHGLTNWCCFRSTFRSLSLSLSLSLSQGGRGCPAYRLVGSGAWAGGGPSRSGQRLACRCCVSFTLLRMGIP